MKTQKLTSEELEKLKNFQIQNNQITNSLGQIEIQKQVLENQKIEVLQQFSKFQEDSSKLSKEYSKKPPKDRSVLPNFCAIANSLYES